MVIILNRALIFDERGEYIKSVKFSNKDQVFFWNNRAFNVRPQDASVYRVNFGILRFRYYYYNISNSEPLTFKKEVEYKFTPKIYNSMLLTKVVEEMNDLNKNAWQKLFTPKNLLFAGIGLAILIYFLQGGKLA